MVIVEYLDGRREEITSWATLKEGNGINQVMLTDGRDIQVTLSGCNGYFCIKYGRGSFGKGFKGETEAVYGIMDTSKAEKELYDYLTTKLSENPIDSEKNIKLRKRYEEVLSELKRKSIYRVSLGISFSYGDDLEIIDSFVKKGTKDIPTFEKVFGKKLKTLFK